MTTSTTLKTLTTLTTRNMTSTHAIDVLSELEEYSNGSQSIGVANESWKKAMFALTKANRNKDRGVVGMESFYTPQMVREDLEASVFVQVDYSDALPDDADAPDLTKETEATTKDEDQKIRKTTAPTYGFLDAWARQQEEQKARKEQPSQSGSAKAAATKQASDGLRQRKGGVATTASESGSDKWTVEETQGSATHIANSIDLFGAFPPRDLKTAQMHAKAAVEGYIQAANRVAKILQILNAAQDTKK